MKSIQFRKTKKDEEIRNNLLKKSIIAGIIGFLSWLFIPLWV